MSYHNPPIESSYRDNDLGRTIYEFVRELRPKSVVEYGALHGYSAAAIAQALRDSGDGGKLTSYDLWEAYSHKHGDIATAREAIATLGLSDFVEFRHGRLGDRSLGEYDLLHLDISNDGDKLMEAISLFDGPILFEGGSRERDEVPWMAEFGRRPMVGSCKYRILNYQFPSISYIDGKKA